MGTVKYLLKVDIGKMMISHIKEEDYVAIGIAKILSVMPSDAVHLRTEEVEEVSLSRNFNLYFDHPLFKDGTEIKLKSAIDHYVDGDRIVVFNILTGVEYINPDGTQRYL